MELSESVNNEPYKFIYIENVLPQTYYNELVNWLENQNYEEGKPRLQNWYQKDNNYFCTKWKYRYDRWKSKKYDDFLVKLEKYISQKTSNLIKKEICFNSCLINKYRDGNDVIGPHRDCVESFGVYPVITGISIGGERTFRINKLIHNDKNMKSLKKEGLYRDIKLKNNSLLIMCGASQKYFSHEILKDDSQSKRYSLTFREFITL